VAEMSTYVRIKSSSEEIQKAGIVDLAKVLADNMADKDFKMDGDL
jgi:hypothetical protein